MGEKRFNWGGYGLAGEAEVEEAGVEFDREFGEAFVGGDAGGEGRGEFDRDFFEAGFGIDEVFAGFEVEFPAVPGAAEDAALAAVVVFIAGWGRVKGRRGRGGWWRGCGII